VIRRIIKRIKREFFYKPGPLEKLKTKPRYTNGQIYLHERNIHFPDAVSFIFTYEEIFKGDIYRFSSDRHDPYILDCGANIGLSTLFFKLTYPGALVVAFEPDKKIFDFLSKNIIGFASSEIILVNKGVWKEDTVLTFFSEGADAGSVVNNNMGAISGSADQVEVTRLSNYIDREVDFLKLDIEGAEIEVIEEINNKLHLVKNLFIEYHSFKGKRQELDKILKILSDNGFRYYIYAPSPLRARPFIDDDTFLSIDCLLSICAQKIDD
jgi:FkbM family methyltransferase